MSGHTNTKDLTPFLQAGLIVEQLTLCPSRPQWPDLHGQFPYHLEKPGTPEKYAPYFVPVKDAVKTGPDGFKSMFNFYNEWDYPTGQYNPQGWFSGSWLLDQLIKPYRLASWPYYPDRNAYGMFYGLQGLTKEEKVRFTRNGTRSDYYCVGNPFTRTCGMATSCAGVQVYDFSVPAKKYEMIAYGCPGDSRTLGGHKPGPDQALDPSSGFISQHEVDLVQGQYSYGKYVMWHGAQFRGTLALQKPYWDQFLLNLRMIPQ